MRPGRNAIAEERVVHLTCRRVRKSAYWLTTINPATTKFAPISIDSISKRRLIYPLADR